MLGSLCASIIGAAGREGISLSCRFDLFGSNVRKSKSSGGGPGELYLRGGVVLSLRKSIVGSVKGTSDRDFERSVEIGSESLVVSSTLKVDKDTLLSSILPIDKDVLLPSSPVDVVADGGLFLLMVSHRPAEERIDKLTF